ncbi:MAG TPA: hypothetical protein DEB39_03780, partial [Planctomycetaceae bacterium]|nr:hypothetical protein [Planctomycetaceae bacterium]
MQAVRASGSRLSCAVRKLPVDRRRIEPSALGVVVDSEGGPAHRVYDVRAVRYRIISLVFSYIFHTEAGWVVDKHSPS